MKFELDSSGDDSIGVSSENSTLANDFPYSFVLDPDLQEDVNVSDISNDDFRHLYEKIMRQIKLIEYHKKHLQMEYSWIQKEKQRIATMKEENKSQKPNKGCSNCRSLKEEHEQEKAQWELLLRIRALQSHLSSALETKQQNTLKR